MKINILYEDNHLLVVEKPINIPVQEDNTKDKDLLTILKEYIKEKYNKPGNVYLGLVHRLDRVVGGVMVFARTSKAASRLSESIRKKEFHKNYLAVCHGKIDSNGQFTDYLKKNDDFNTIVTNSKEGKLSRLSYELIDYDKDRDLSLVKVMLETGRHHQIRVQFSSRNHSLFGDNRYGNDKEQLIGLFAYQLSFVHPVKKEIMTFTYIPHDKPFNLFKIENVV
jgi:23S rRNA pseudouridine1911/1915/1917 synthase